MNDTKYEDAAPSEEEGPHLLREMKLVYTRAPSLQGHRITSSRDVFAFLVEDLGLDCETTEHFIVLLLDAKNHPLGWERVGKGGLSACPVAPSDVFRSAIWAGATALVLAHNHPSGDSTPSPEDIALTDRLKQAGEVVGIRILDHVIVGGMSYFSFLDAGLLIQGGE